jgi:hypothetical protein
VTSNATRAFWEAFDSLPATIQRQARAKYELWKHHPFHPSLHFKELTNDVWSARITLDYRAMARRRGERIVWFWIGTHEEYNRLIGAR